MQGNPNPHLTGKEKGAITYADRDNPPVTKWIYRITTLLLNITKYYLVNIKYIKNLRATCASRRKGRKKTTLVAYFKLSIEADCECLQ